MPESSPLYPLLFDPIYKEKVWGGRALERLGRELPGDSATPIGESWELVDLACTSASGGGGGAEHSVVSNGPLAGKTIRELMTTYGEALLGHGVSPAADGGFPLLIKFLDAKENLSVQVHPSPAYAAAHPDAHLKSEAWYVVDCKPGAVIYKGLRPGTTPEQLRTAIQANTDDAVVPLLNAVPVKPGDCHYLPSGTLHALGAGVLVAEVQTPSDTTFRVYDWGRTDRELHVEQAMACIDFDAPATYGPNAWETCETHRGPDTTITHRVRCPFFEIALVDAEHGDTLAFSSESPEIWVVLTDNFELFSQSGTSLRVSKGQTVLLPPGAGKQIAKANGSASWLRITVPKMA